LWLLFGRKKEDQIINYGFQKAQAPPLPPPTPIIGGGGSFGGGGATGSWIAAPSKNNSAVGIPLLTTPSFVAPVNTPIEKKNLVQSAVVPEIKKGGLGYISATKKESPSFFANEQFEKPKPLMPVAINQTVMTPTISLPKFSLGAPQLRTGKVYSENF
jgi:hypothetical protein